MVCAETLLVGGFFCRRVWVLAWAWGGSGGAWVGCLFKLA